MKNKPQMAIDALGRGMPSPGVTGTRRADRTVGLFYFLWLESGRHKLYDISKITAADPQAGYKPDSPVWGKYGEMHFWGEPFYGYYAQSDEWVVRRHMKLIMAADIDFLFFDTTNAEIYEDNVKLVMRILQEYHDDGFKVPQVMFYTNTLSGETVQWIYDRIYAQNWCPDTWFCLDGKPVIIAHADECSEVTRAFFNIQKAQWPNEPDKIGGWPWMDFTRPQRVFPGENGSPATLNVSVAQHPQLHFGDSVLYGETTNCGRAWHDGANDPDPDAWLHGYNFAEQFERALEADTPLVLITGWNEWIAGRWTGTKERPLSFVDCANYEYSRDIEMMRGGYFDNFYMQLVNYVRRYKGCDGVPATPAGDAAHYDSFADGGMPRDAAGWRAAKRYKNHTQRNVIRSIDVSHTAGDITFTIHTAAPLNTDTAGSFMNLYISTGKAAGFDFAVGKTVDLAAGTASVSRICRAAPDGTAARPCDTLAAAKKLGDAAVCIDGSRYTVRIPRALLGLNGDDFEIWFKAADSTKRYTCVDQFYENGDCAPLGRLGFVYRGTR